MQAVILLGGKGTRLSSLYPDLPKALAPVGGKPFLQWQFEWLLRGRITEIHLAAGHLAERIEDWMSRKAPSQIQWTFSCEPAPLGTGGGLKFVEPFVRSDPFMVLNGDSLMPNLDIQALENFHNHFPMLGTLAVTQIEESGRYGTVEFDEQEKVTAFREKAERRAGWINGGVYVFGKRIFDLIEPGKMVSIETDLFPILADQRQLQIFKAPPPLLDMGTPDGLRNMERMLAP